MGKVASLLTELRFNIYRKQATEQARKTEQASEEKAGQGAGQASETDTKAGQGAGQASEIDIKAGQALEGEEIILVDFLAKNPRSNIREMAQKLVLSKSAVDRLIKNLKLKKLSNALELAKKAIGRF